jgi:hypothetical protein
MQFTWNEDAMGTGVPLIDAQHRELIARYNRFHDALLEGQGREHLLHVLEFLIAYANIHFPQEEALMDLHDSPVAEPNRPGPLVGLSGVESREESPVRGESGRQRFISHGNTSSWAI